MAHVSVLTFVVLCLATYRATRFITADSLIDRQRLWWFKRFPPKPTAHRRAHKLGQLIECSWCVGWWAAGASCSLAAWTQLLPRRPETWWLLWPAVSCAVGLIGTVLDPT